MHAVWVASLIGGLISFASSVVGRVLLALGIGYVSYSGIDLALTQFRTLFEGGGHALGSQIAGMLGVLKIGTGFNIIASSIAARLVLSGLTSGTLKKMVVK